MNNEQENNFNKTEKVEKDNPGFNGNFDTLIPSKEECDKAAQRCKSAYEALKYARNLGKVGASDVKEKTNEKE